MFNLLFVFLTFFQVNNFKSKLTEPEIIAERFMSDMKKGLDVRKYLSDGYISNNGLDKTDWQSDYFMVKRYKISLIYDNTIQVNVDHGSGDYCTQFELFFINEKGNLKILPSKFIYEPKIKRDIVIPWQNRKKICE